MCIRDSFETLKRDLERENITTSIKMNYKTGVDKLEIENEDDLKRCLLYTSDAADERSSVDLGGRRIIKKKKKI